MDALMIIVIGIPLGLLTTLILISFVLLEPIRRLYGSFVDVHRNVQRLSLYMNLLEERRMDLPPDTQGPAREWADGVSSLMQKVDDFQHQYENWMQMAVFSSLILRYRIAQSAGLLLEEVEDCGGRVNVDAGWWPPPLAVEELPQVNKVFGQQRILDEALYYIQDSRTKVIGIYGPGGVGKTTLLIQINNYLVQRPDQASSNNAESRATKDYGFDHVVWATVSREINHENLQDDIAHCLGLTLSHEQSLEERAGDIRKCLGEKGFLLLLDDVWAPLDLKNLGIPDLYRGGFQFRRKLVFTTRFKNIYGSQLPSTTKMIKVAFMSEDHAWQLFTRMLFVQCDDPNLDIAKDIAKQCGGLPVALKAIGQAMSSRRSLQEWEDALELLKNSQPIYGMENMMVSLEQTYNTLSDDKIKECFLCCGLWPKGFSIDKNELIQCWMGMGLLDDGDHVGVSYWIGRYYIKTLKKAGLLEVCDNKLQEVKMHNVIRIMALDIAFRKHNWIVQAGVGLQQAPSDTWHWAAAESISLMFNGITTLPGFERDKDHEFLKLSALMLQHSSLNVIPKTFFPCMPKLTYLDLSHTYSLTELPGEICLLTELRYINLSKTGIRSLPLGLERLNLRCLILRDTRKLELLSRSMIPSTLQLLDVYGSSGVWKTVEQSSQQSVEKTISMEETYPQAVEKALKMEETSAEAVEENIFGGLNSLQVLNVTVRSTQMLRMLSMLSYVQLQCIAIGDNTTLESLDLEPSFVWEQLEELKIFNLVKLKFLHMNFYGPWLFENLQVLHLDSLQELNEIVCRRTEKRDLLPRLWSLSISGCGKLESVSWASPFWRLKYLGVFSCLGMTRLFDDFRFAQFDRLKTLHLERLPNLETIYPGSEWPFPSIVNITVDGCPKLRRLPFQQPPDRIKEIKGDQEWWDGLHWKDDTIRVSLQTYFVPIPNCRTGSTASTSRWDPL